MCELVSGANTVDSDEVCAVVFREIGVCESATSVNRRRKCERKVVRMSTVSDDVKNAKTQKLEAKKVSQVQLSFARSLYLRSLSLRFCMYSGVLSLSLRFSFYTYPN